ncbi:hypothetical protein [Enterobacter roggenkampii]|uniref:hypothetical protein n=1 Tax=Enterobacter roggenkampii TaxID=1812935 RepID=UPI00201A4951|nr:hypothetical protein [Enterobacter roggenkampii]MCL5592319.1 hypothetical protein [Enterobacter roggenkampii]
MKKLILCSGISFVLMALAGCSQNQLNQFQRQLSDVSTMISCASRLSGLPVRQNSARQPAPIPATLLEKTHRAVHMPVFAEREIPGLKNCCY